MPPKKKRPKPLPAREQPDVSIVVSRPATAAQPRMMERVAMRTSHRVFRWVETFSFVASIVVLLSYMIVEVLHRGGMRLGPADPDHGFPYGVLIGSIILIAPKMIGKFAAGRALVAVAGRGGNGQIGETGVTAERETGGA